MQMKFHKQSSSLFYHDGSHHFSNVEYLFMFRVNIYAFDNWLFSFQVACLKFINTLLNTTRNLNRRVYLQYELELAEFDAIELEKVTRPSPVG